MAERWMSDRFPCSPSALSPEAIKFYKAVANLGRPKFHVRLLPNGKDQTREFGRPKVDTFPRPVSDASSALGI